nr:enolase C-terminal domain-like protein [Kineosporia mesophila]
MRRRLHHASADTTFLHSVIARISLSDGTSGWGEIRANGEYATGEGLSVMVDALLATRCEGPAEEVAGWLLERSVLAAAVVDAALWDARSRRSGRPLHTLLEERFGLAPGPGSVRTHAQIMFTDDHTVVRSALDQGFRKLKVRVGGAVDDDLLRLGAVRRAAGPQVEITVDANGGWSTDQALAALPGLADLGITWVEQPVRTAAELAVVREQAGPVRLRADESIHGPEDLDALEGAVDGVHLKLEKSGTVERLFRLAAVCTARGLDVALGQMDQGRLGCAHTTQLASALGLATAELWGCADVTDDLASPLTLREGAVLVPAGPLTVDLPPHAEEIR